MLGGLTGQSNVIFTSVECRRLYKALNHFYNLNIGVPAEKEVIH